jgi:hypothetical protein
MNRLLTDGGTPLEAMHMYAPMLERGIRVRYSTGPSTLSTEKTLNTPSLTFKLVQTLTRLNMQMKQTVGRCTTIHRLLTLNESFGARHRIWMPRCPK